MKLLNVFYGVAFISFASCISTYPIQKKTPCEQTTIQEKIKMIENVYTSSSMPFESVVTEKGVKYGKKSYDYENIKYVRVSKKPGFLYLSSNWSIQIKEFDGESHLIQCKEHELVEKANNALMCLSNLQETNGRPSDSKKQSAKEESVIDENKYDALAKLKKLLDSGAITQEEYEKEKGLILNK